MIYIINDILIPAISVGCAEVLTLPICTLKSNYQNTHSTSLMLTFKDMIDIAKAEYNGNYFKVFYRASLPAVTSQVFSTTSKMTLYRYLSQYYDNLMLNGAVAGVCVSLITHPFDTIKIRDQMRTNILLQSEASIIKNLYKGYSKSLAKTLVGGMMYFPLFDYIKSLNLNSTQSAFLSATISTCILHPFDYVKTRQCANLQWFNGYNPIKYMKGLHVNLLRIVPHFTISMTLIEWLRNCRKN
jgi:hypothetical protein